MLKILRIPLINRLIAYVLICSMMLITNGCYYFKVKEAPDTSPELIGKMQDEKRFIILHLEDKAWQLSNITLKEKSVDGEISVLSDHEKYKTARLNKSNRYKKHGSHSESGVVNEVHVYVSGFQENQPGKISIPIDGIRKIEIYDKDQGATIATWVFGILGVTAGAFTVLMVIVLLTKSSCPFVYIHNGNDYLFTGEIFSGATQPGLERDDYLLLPGIRSSDGEYKLKLTNEVTEIQYVNYASLIIVDHPAKTSVLFDKYGVLQTMSDLNSPVSARNRSGNNILEVITVKDSLNYSGDAVMGNNDGCEKVYLQFLNINKSKSAKLVIRAKNSFWLDVLFTRFHKLFGEKYEKFSLNQESESQDKLKKFLLDQNIPLSVYVEKDGEWQSVDYFNLAGPMAMRDDVLPLDLTGINGDTLNIKLETGFLFWELDYAAMDFGLNEPLNISESPVTKAVKNGETDVINLLQTEDLKYLVLKDVGDEVSISFAGRTREPVGQSVFLHSSGYYKILRDQEGPANMKTLRTFRKPGRFPEFSREVYELLTIN